MTRILWDWNGTLLDDTEISRGVLNGMLSRRGLPTVSLERYREIFTFPIIDYYRKAGFDFTVEPYEVLAADYIEKYPIAARNAGLAAGAAELLAEIRAAGFSQTIISAAESNSLRAQVASLGVDCYFDAICGADDGLGGGKEAVAARWLAENSAENERRFYIGDTLHDFETAQILGCTPILVTLGHQDRARLEISGAVVVDSFDALRPIIFAETEKETLHDQ